MTGMDGMDEGACCAPEAITPEALLVHATERPDPAVAAHLATCPHCAAEAADYARLDRFLHARLHRAVSPNSHMESYRLNLHDGLTDP